MSTETNPTPAAPGIDGKTIAILSYFTWIGWIIAFVLYNSNKSQLAAYHLRQSLTLMILGILVYIVGVITAPDKPAGRGMKVTESAVKKYAVRHHLKVLQPEKLKNIEFLDELRSLNADLQIVVAFRMLPESVWNMPPLGTINLHG